MCKSDGLVYYAVQLPAPLVSLTHPTSNVQVLYTVCVVYEEYSVLYMQVFCGGDIILCLHNIAVTCVTAGVGIGSPEH